MASRLPEPPWCSWYSPYSCREPIPLIDYYRGQQIIRISSIHSFDVNMCRCRASEKVECRVIVISRWHPGSGFKNRRDHVLTQTALMEAETWALPSRFITSGHTPFKLPGASGKEINSHLCLSHKYLFQEEMPSCICFILFVKCKWRTTAALSKVILKELSRALVLCNLWLQQQCFC